MAVFTRHVLAINHTLKKYNVRYQMVTIGQSNRKSKSNKRGTGGKTNAPLPALEKEPVLDDSSDEEQAELLALGEQGL